MTNELQPDQSAASDAPVNDTRWGGGPDDARKAGKKPRKQRPCFSCEECRRLKMKCDRRVPCSHCVRRHRAEFCNGAPTRGTSSRRESAARLAQRQNAAQAQQPQTPVEQGQFISAPSLGFDHQELRQDKQSHHPHPSQPQLQSKTSTTAQRSSQDQNRTPVAQDTRNQDQSGQFSLLSRSLGPCIAQGAISQSPPSLTPGNAGPLNGIPSRDGGSSSTALQHIDHGEQNGSHGTLMLSKGGRSKYLGPTAGSEWLKDSETQDVSTTPIATRAPSPENARISLLSEHGRPIPDISPIAFPFNAAPARISTRDLLSCLPPRDEAWTLVESYYRYCAWHHDVAPKTSFQKTFNHVYTLLEAGSLSPVDPQEIALVFIIMAQGTMFNIETADNDSSAEELLHLSERALVKGDFLSNNTVAGLQTLHLMAHLHLQLDKGRRGDNAYPLWGLIMRLIQAMGMHRDGTRWNLPQDVVEERRKVFWECNAADIFQAHCFSRPSAINPEHCDTAFPTEPLNVGGVKSYSILRFELSQLSSECLNMAMKVQKPEYSTVTDLHVKLCEFERTLPFYLRSRAALLAMPSQYPQPEAAIEASPEPSRRSMTVSFQQMNLALNISETIINLHRPYYAKALYENIDDRVASVYAPSYLTVIERCAIMIAIVADIHARFPVVSTRQWNFWFHVFGSALCLGTLVLRDPGNAMTPFVLEQIDSAIRLFTSLIHMGRGTPRYQRNLQWLIKLRARAFPKISATSTGKRDGLPRDTDTDRQRIGEEKEDGEDVELLGWRTRLIERAGQDHQTVRTIGPHIIDISNLPPNQNHFGTPKNQPNNLESVSSGRSPSFATFESTDDILHDFWDSMIPQDILGTFPDQRNSFGNNGPAWWGDTTTYQ